MARSNFQRKAGKTILIVQPRQLLKLKILVEAPRVGKDGGHPKRVVRGLLKKLRAVEDGYVVVSAGNEDLAVRQ